MLKEITVAAEFFARLFRLSPTTTRGSRFLESLISSLQARYNGRWHPILHSAHRAVTIFGGIPDQVLLSALNEAGIGKEEVKKVTESVPKELVVWVDPGEVAFRVGDHCQPTVLFRESDQDTGKGTTKATMSGELSEGSNQLSPPTVPRAVRITSPNSGPDNSPTTAMSTTATTTTTAAAAAVTATTTATTTTASSVPVPSLGKVILSTAAQPHGLMYNNTSTYTQPQQQFHSFQHHQQNLYQQPPYQHFQFQQPLSGPFFPTHLHHHHRQPPFQMHFHQPQPQQQQQQQHHYSQLQQPMVPTQPSGVRMHTSSAKPVVRYVEAR